MIATCSAVARPALRHAVGAGLCKRVPVYVSRPLTAAVRAYKDDAAAPKDTHKQGQEKQHQVVAPKQHEAAPAVAPRSMHHPAVRLPSLLHEMQREMDAMTRMFGLPSLFDDDLFSSSSMRAPQLQLQLPAMPSMMRVAVDVEEDDKAYTIKADTPGIPKDSLKLSVLDGTLTISGERLEEKQEGGGAGGEEAEGASEAATASSSTKAPLRYERSYGSFRRSFSLPPNVDVEAISAEAKDGVLTVTIPKRPQEKPQPKEIAVN